MEDFTGHGLQDLQDRLIRTPLSPFETFRDDPLRVIRLIRFSSRFAFPIIQEVMDMMSNEEIKVALQTKISRERVGVELEKILLGVSSGTLHVN